VDSRAIPRLGPNGLTATLGVASRRDFPMVRRRPQTVPVTDGQPGRSADTASLRAALQSAEAVAQASHRALGDSVAGVLLHGSLALGDFVPGRSDIDLLVVVDDPLTHAQLAALGESAGKEGSRAPGPVDLRVVTREVTAAPTPLPPMEAYLRIRGDREPTVRAEGRHPGERDLVVELSVCRTHGRALLGAPPAELIGDVPDKWVLDAGDAQLADWQEIGDDPPYAQLTVLTACRLWRFAEERQHGSKDAAGEWALRRDPSLAVVRQALHQRRSDPSHPIDAEQIHDLLVLVRRRVSEARA
jgi:predicted nucleotidyltransferase